MAQFCYILSQKSRPEPPLFYRSNSDKIMPSNAPNKPNHSWDMGDDCDGVGWLSANSTKQNPTISLHHDAQSIWIQNLTNWFLRSRQAPRFAHNSIPTEWINGNRAQGVVVPSDHWGALAVD